MKLNAQPFSSGDWHARRRKPIITLAMLSVIAIVTLSASNLAPGYTEKGHTGIALASAVPHFHNCRTGTGVGRSRITTYAVDPLNLGWYADWNAFISGSANDMEYMMTIRVKQDTSHGTYLPTYTTRPPLTNAPDGLGPVVEANPGSVWLIGNEPDIESQDGTVPEKYAEIYHEVYHFIKAIDPTARVSIGSVVQPSPLRLEYLDRVLSTYKSLYGVKLPVDVWSTHLYVAREVRNEWGLRIPVGIEGVDYGRVYTRADAVDIDKFTQLVYELRTWMKARGYQNVPLVIPEWGGIMPLWFLPVTEEEFHTFVRDAVAFITNTRDTEIGYPGDDYRLVQQAAFWSLDADDTFDNGSPKFGPTLFQSASPHPITSTGIYYRDVIVPSYPPEVDLFPRRAWASLEDATVERGGSTSVTLHAMISNAGNTAFGTDTHVQFINVTGGAYELLGTARLEPFTGCGNQREVSLHWPDLGVGMYDVMVRIDSGNVVGEVREDNNTLMLSFLIGTDVVYMPLVGSNF